ncbi:MAG TPA: hypothetical protein VGM31_11470 [Puia sp.]
MSYNRRNFIQSTASATSALLLGPLDGWPTPTPAAVQPHADFSMKVLATDWGFRGSIEDYCSRVKKDGYDGIEIWWPWEKEKQTDLFTA